VRTAKLQGERIQDVESLTLKVFRWHLPVGSVLVRLARRVVVGIVVPCVNRDGLLHLLLLMPIQRLTDQKKKKKKKNTLTFRRLTLPDHHPGY
jgi:hypothetical protein